MKKIIIIVIIVLALVFTVALIVVGLPMTDALKKAKISKASGVCTLFEIAVNNFEFEYEYLPYGASMKDPKNDQSFRSDSDLMAVLTGHEEDINFKQIRFFEQSIAKGDHPSNYRDGIHIGGGNVTLYDPWGNLYYIIIDYDGDEKIQHPYKKGEVITGKKALIYSAGPDGKIGTEKENRDNPSNFQ